MVSESMASPSAEEQNVAGGDLRNPARTRRRRFNIYKWGELGCGLGLCLVLAGCAGGSAAVAFFPRRLAVWGMAAFVLERLSDREVLVGKGSPRQPIRKKAADAILPLCATHTGHGREKWSDQ